MAWETVAESDSLEGLGQALTEDMELPKGTKIRFVMQLIAPIGFVFSLPGMELLFRPFIPGGIDLVDVHGHGTWGAMIECEADPAWLIAVLAFVRAHWLAISLISIGLAWGLAELIKSIRCDVDRPAPLESLASIIKWGSIGAICIGGLVLLSKVVKRQGGAA